MQKVFVAFPHIKIVASQTKPNLHIEIFHATIMLVFGAEHKTRQKAKQGWNRPDKSGNWCLCIHQEASRKSSFIHSWRPDTFRKTFFKGWFKASNKHKNQTKTFLFFLYCKPSLKGQCRFAKSKMRLIFNWPGHFHMCPKFDTRGCTRVYSLPSPNVSWDLLHRAPSKLGRCKAGW